MEYGKSVSFELGWVELSVLIDCVGCFLFTEPIPSVIKDAAMLEAKGELVVVPLNHPYPIPSQLRHRVTYWTRHGFYLHFQASQWLKPCETSVHSTGIVVLLIDSYHNNTEIELCHSGNYVAINTDDVSVHFESLFHSLTIEYEQIDGNESFVLESLGSIASIEGKIIFLRNSFLKYRVAVIWVKSFWQFDIRR